MKLTKDNLVLYKQAPALITAAGDKLDIALPGGKSKSVREKDVLFLHPGPVPGFPDLESSLPEGRPEEAWELLQGESPTLTELAELVYGSHTPATSWAAFKLLNRSPWFRGTPDAIEVTDEETAAARIKAETGKAEAEARWDDFLNRFKSGAVKPEEDEPFLRDLEMYALGRSKGSRILKALGKAQTPENAHRVLVARKARPASWNPHPLRLDVPLDAPAFPLGELPETERLDLTHLEAFAIDDEGSKDPDDAIAWDGETLWVHVVDAAGLIPPGSDADQAAGERASSLYLPEMTVPMLPPEAAEHLGLGLHETSPALSYAFHLNDDLTVREFSIHLARVRVTRLTYAQADGMMSREPFASMKRITDAFRNRRMESGAVSINMPEVKIRVDGEGEVSITSLPRLDSREMVAESMLMAGTHAALWCREQNLSVPFAVQEGPDKPAEPSEGPASEEGSGADYVAQFARRRGMKRSRTTLECSTHSGLGLEAYTRVTSPLRRYPDLMTSQQIRAVLLGTQPLDAEEMQKNLAAFESRAGSLVQAERRSNLFWKIQWLAARPGWKCRAVMVDRRERQGFFLIPEIAMETRAALKKEVPLGGWVTLALKETDIADSSALFVIREVLES